MYHRVFMSLSYWEEHSYQQPTWWLQLWAQISSDPGSQPNQGSLIPDEDILSCNRGSGIRGMGGGVALICETLIGLGCIHVLTCESLLICGWFIAIEIHKKRCISNGYGLKLIWIVLLRLLRTFYLNFKNTGSDCILMLLWYLQSFSILINVIVDEISIWGECRIFDSKGEQYKYLFHDYGHNVRLRMELSLIGWK